MERYSRINEKFPREIVLLKAHPCKWGKCSFCDYIKDNSRDTNQIIEFNRKILKDVTGQFKRLEVINSASVFDFPKESLEDIKKLAREKEIRELVFESHWIYRDKLGELREYFDDIKLFFKIGVESFDYDFRNKVLNKAMFFKNPSQVAEFFDSPCLLVCIEGQTREMIKKDIQIALDNFKRCTINVYNNNSTPIKRDEKLYKWFLEEFKYLKNENKAEVLLEITDFGVG